MNPSIESQNTRKEVRLSKKHSRFLRCEQDSQGNYIFSFRFADKLPKGPLVEVKRLTKQETIRARKIYTRTYEKKSATQNIPQHALMGWLFRENEKAHQENKQGVLDGKLTPEQIQHAKQQIIPEGFEIHHLCPISLGGSNKYENLYLVSHRIHRALHQCMDCVLAYIPYTTDKSKDSTKFFLQLPVIDRCLTDSCGLFPPERLKDKATPQTIQSSSIPAFCRQNKRSSNTY